jgi:muconolactone D-isomerase
MEFLVQIKVTWPNDGDSLKKEAVIAAERSRVAELRAEGKLKRLWRLPGRWENITLWDVVDATELDRALRSLPMFPWLVVEVQALVEHPSDPRNSEE